MTYKSVNSYTNETFNEYQNASSKEIESALQMAADLAHTWESESRSKRAEILHTVANQLRAQKSSMAEIMTQEMVN